MQRTASRVALILVPLVLWSLAAAAQDRQGSKDPWRILDGTYYPPGTRQIPLPELPRPTAEEDVTLKGEWAATAETYRRSLERLGQKDRDGLLRRVVDLEVAALGEQPEHRMERLARVELDVARALAKRDPEILVPMFQLHHDLYLKHREARHWYLLLHSVSMVEQLASLYVDETGSQGARINAARILASLGGYLQAAQQPASVKLFEKVLELDPTNESAYLGLAAHYEKRGGPFEPVIQYLERLLEVYPDHREARLRLAINKLRVGRDDEGSMLLHQLVDEPSSDWVYRLAAQELARYEARQGRLGRAIAVLERAIENAPGDQKLCIQLAFLYDRNRQSFDAHRTAEMASAGEPAAEPPRGRYNTWPHKALEQDREELRRLAESRVQLLARILHDQRPGAPEDDTPNVPEPPEVNP